MNELDQEEVVIVGGGQAASQCAFSLRQKGWAGGVTIVGDEPFHPYQRPPLSKAYLAGALTADRLKLRADALYDGSNIRLRLGATVVAIDRAAREVELGDGESLPYDRLVLATGARVRRLNTPGADLDGVCYLRNIGDVDKLRRGFSPGAKLTIVGAGYIGLEVAAVAVKLGLAVTVVEAQDRVLKRVAGETISRYFEALHRSHGVKFVLDASISGLDGDARVRQLRLADGGAVDCDEILVGIGVVPNIDLAEAAGLSVNDGIVVDAHCRTEDPRIFAIGDCTRHPSRYFGGELRLESVHNAIEQGKTAAASICGENVPYDQVPWFWSDQYDVKLQTAGVSAGRADEEILRGDPKSGAFSVFYMKNETPIAVDSVNAPGDHMASRKLLAESRRLSRADLADETRKLKDVMAKTEER